MTPAEEDVMKTQFTLIALLLCTLFAGALAQTTQPAGDVPDKAEVRRAIDEFLKSPDSANSPQARLINEFAEKSPDVLVSPFPELFRDWMVHQPPYPNARLLFTVYIAASPATSSRSSTAT
jgi:hypothetical protein